MILSIASRLIPILPAFQLRSISISKIKSMFLFLAAFIARRSWLGNIHCVVAYPAGMAHFRSQAISASVTTVGLITFLSVLVTILLSGFMSLMEKEVAKSTNYSM